MLLFSPFIEQKPISDGLGLKINVPSAVWLIHSLSGVICVPSTTMSQASRGEGELSQCKEMNELTPLNESNML